MYESAPTMGIVAMDGDRFLSALDTAYQFVEFIDVQCRALLPLSFYTEGPTQEDFDALCKAIDGFEECVRVLGSVRWEHDGPMPSKASLQSFYTCLGDLDCKDAKTRRVKDNLDDIAKFHVMIIAREGGPYPNDLPFAILHQVLRSIPSLLHSIEQYRSWLRQGIHILTRQKIRPLTVLDLPTELLIEIFGHLRGSSPSYPYLLSSYYPHGSVRDIQNVRLTCHRFCTAGSYFLVGHVNVGLRPESLSRLEKISQHPTIGKGVRLVRLSLISYYTELSSDLRRFAEYSSHRITQNIELLQDAARRPKSFQQLFSDLSYADVGPTLDRYGLILTAWERFAQHREELPESDAFVQVLRTAHQNYQQLFDVQMRLLKDGEFVQAFAKALAQMPQAKSLVIEDGFPFNHPYLAHRQPIHKAIYNPNALCWTFLEPLTTSSADQCGFDVGSSMGLILDILAAISGTGVSLKNLKIHTDCAGDTARLDSSPGIQQRISTLCKELGHASIHFGTLQQSSPANARNDFYQLLLAILDSDSLEYIDISLGDIQSQDSNHFDIGPVLNRQKRPSLCNLSLQGVAIHAAGLEPFTRSLKSRGFLKGDPYSEFFQGVHFHISDLQVLSGTWAEVLDALRTKSNFYASIQNPSGAECEHLSEEEYAKIFTRPGKGLSCDNPSLAEKYVQDPFCSDLDNPLRSS